MEKLTETYITYLKTEHGESMNRRQKLQAIESMRQELQGKTREELCEIWKNNLQEVTECHFAAFDNAQDIVKGGRVTRVRWKINTLNKKSWWIKAMQKTEPPKKTGPKTGADAWYEKVDKVSKEAFTEVWKLKPDQKIHLQIELRKVILLLKGQCFWCENGKPTFDGYCSQSCKDQAKKYDEHTQGAA